MDTLVLQEADMPKHLCQRCRDRKARFRYRGVVRADRNRTLCFECYRSERNRPGAQRLSGHTLPLPTPFGRTLDERQIAHRERMLAHLQHPSQRVIHGLALDPVFSRRNESQDGQRQRLWS